MLEILNGTNEELKANIDLLAKDYFEKTGRKVCRACPSDVQYMILSLKNIYKMTNFSFKKHAAQYKNKKGDTTTISNNTMTDEKAVEFLRTNPERISLFSVYPKNWKELLKKKALTPEQIEANLAIEAEINAIQEAKKEGTSDEETEAEKINRMNAESEAKAIAAAGGETLQNGHFESDEAKRSQLMKLTLKQLRADYPKIKATSIKEFVDKVLK